MSFQRLPNSTLSHRATLFGKVVEHDHHLVAWSLPVTPDSLANLVACKYLKYRVYCATVGFRTADVPFAIEQALSARHAR